MRRFILIIQERGFDYNKHGKVEGTTRENGWVAFVCIYIISLPASSSAAAVAAKRSGSLLA